VTRKRVLLVEQIEEKNNNNETLVTLRGAKIKVETKNGTIMTF